MTRSRLVFALLLVAAPLASMGLSALRRASLVPDASYSAAAADVRARFRDHDLVVATPHYMIGPQRELGDLPFLSPRALTSADVLGYARVHLLEVEAIGANAQAREQLVALGRAGDERSWPGVHLTTFTLEQPTTKVVDFFRDLERVRVEARYAGDTEFSPCATWRRDRYVCPRDPAWNYVGRETFMIGNEPRACVWLHPVRQGGVMRATLPDVTTDFAMDSASSPLRVVGGVGFAVSGALHAKEPVRVHVRVGDTEIWQTTHAVNESWEPFDAPLVGAGPLTIEVDTDDNGAAHFCVALSVIAKDKS